MITKIFIIIIGFVNPQEQASFQEYATEMRTLYEKHDAEIVDRYPIAMSALGGEKPDFVMVVEFPNQQKLQALFSSEEYQKIIPLREKGFKDLNVYISPKQVNAEQNE